MKREEILDLEPGRELDALIAEKVMTFKIESPSAEQCTIWDGREVRYFEPSTDISAAWEVVEKLRESHLYTDIRTCADFYEVWVQIPPFQEEHVQTETIAHPKLPYAICKAALLALLEEEET